MNIADFDSYRRLKDMRAKMIEFERAIDAFEGDLIKLGALRAKHYVTRIRAEELQESIRKGVDHVYS